MSIVVSPRPQVADAVGDLHAEFITSLAALEGLRPEWERLLPISRGATPFQSPHWLLPWWKRIGRGTLASVAVRRSSIGRLVGLLPLYVYTNPATRQRHLFPIGIATTDVLEPLLEPQAEQPVLACAFAKLAAHSAAWDVLEWPQLRPDSAVLNAAWPRGWRREVIEGEPSPALTLVGGRAGRLPVPASMAQNIRTARSRAQRSGRLAYRRADAGSIGEALDVLARLHTRRWSERGLPGVLADGDVIAAHREAAPSLHAAGMLRLYTLRLDDTPIAALYCLADAVPGRERRWFHYLGSFEPRHAALSPGTLLIAHAVDEAMREDAVAFDFLRGAEPYKYRWGAVDQPMFTLRVWRDEPASRCADG